MVTIHIKNNKRKRLSEDLQTWFLAAKRDLPWRVNRTWYSIWISEVMLQQTQVNQVIPYFNRFIENFPTIERLAQATQQEVLKIWQGLGYYARARNLHHAAQQIVSRFNSQIPTNKKELIKLPGFGAYTSHALLSLAFNQPYAVVDGNITRVVARLFAINQDIQSPNSKRKIQFIMDSILDKRSPAVFNEAMMECGATICMPLNPHCNKCPINRHCLAFQNNRVHLYPFKSATRKKPHIHAYTFLLRMEDKLLLAKRPQKGLLAGLWEFPCYFFKEGQNGKNFDCTQVLKKIGFIGKHIYSWPEIRHSYTHFHLHLKPHYFHLIKNKNQLKYYDDSAWFDFNSIEALPIHRAVQKVMMLIDAKLKIIT